MAKILKGLNETIKAFDGKEIKNEDNLPIFVGRLMANAIAQARSKDPVRAILIAQNLYKAEKELKIEDADFELVKDIIAKNEVFSNAIKAPLINVLNTAEEAK